MTFGLACQVHLGRGHLPGLGGKPQGHHHDHACDEEKERRRRDLAREYLHAEITGCNSGDAPGLIGIPGCHRHPDEVHEVVPREGEGQGKGAHRYDDLVQVDLENRGQQVGKRGPDREGDRNDHGLVAFQAAFDVVVVIGPLQALHEDEIGDRRKCYPAEQG